MLKEDILKKIEQIEEEKEIAKDDYKKVIREKNKEQRKLKKVIRLLEKE